MALIELEKCERAKINDTPSYLFFSRLYHESVKKIIVENKT